MRTDGSNANWTAFYDNEVTEAGPFAVLGGGVGFAAFGSEGSGRELWRLGQAGVPQRVADIATGADSSDPQQLTPFDSGLMFRARTSASGTELWRSDGTAVAQVADIRPGPASSEPSRLTPIGSDLLFTADDGAHGHELWRSTGSAAGTHLLADIAPGVRSSDTTWIQRVGDRLVFDAGDAAAGRELWSIPLPLPAPPAPPPLPPPPSDAGSAGTGSTATGPTISSGDDSGTLLATSAQPSPLAPQELTTVTATEPGSRADRTPPRLSRPALQRRRAWVYLQFRVNEPGQVKVIAEVRRRGRWRTVATPLVKRCRKGVNAIRIPASLRRPGVRFVLTAMDTAGNRSRPVVLRTRN